MSILELKNIPGYGEGKILKTTGDSLIWSVDQTGTAGGSGSIKYLSQYPSLSAAISAINANGQTPATILMGDMDYTVGAPGATPSNICLVNGGGILTVPAGITLTVGSMGDCGNRRFFNCLPAQAANGSTPAKAAGSVVFDKGAVPFFRLAWWLGNDLSLDATNAVRDIHRSFIKNKGGLAIVTGMRPVSGNLYVPDSIIWQGDGRGSVFGLSSGFILTNPNSCIFRAQGKVQDENNLVGSPYKDILFKDLVLDCNNTPAAALLITGEYPNSIHSVRGENVDIKNSTSVGIDCFSTGQFGVQIEDFSLSNYRFYNCQTNFRINTENSSVTFDSGFAELRNDMGGATCFDVVTVGKMAVRDLTTVCNAPYDANHLPTGNATFLRTTNVINNLTFSGLQDEGITNFAVFGGTDLDSLISVRDSLIQSKIHFKPSALRNVTFDNVKMNSGLFSDEPGALGIVTLNDVVIRAVDRANNPVVPHLIEGGAAASFAGSSFFSEKNIKNPQSLAGRTFGHFNRFSLPATLSFQANQTAPAFVDDDGVGTTRNYHTGTRFGVQYNNQSIAEFGLEIGNDFFYGMRCYREGGTGKIVWQINQNVPFKFLNSLEFPKGKGIILTSEDGTVSRRLILNNDGSLTTAAG